MTWCTGASTWTCSSSCACHSPPPVDVDKTPYPSSHLHGTCEVPGKNQFNILRGHPGRCHVRGSENTSCAWSGAALAGSPRCCRFRPRRGFCQTEEAAAGLDASVGVFKMIHNQSPVFRWPQTRTNAKNYKGRRRSHRSLANVSLPFKASHNHQTC